MSALFIQTIGKPNVLLNSDLGIGEYNIEEIIDFFEVGDKHETNAMIESFKTYVDECIAKGLPIFWGLARYITGGSPAGLDVTWLRELIENDKKGKTGDKKMALFELENYYCNEWEDGLALHIGL